MQKTLVRTISTLFPHLVVSFAYKQLTRPQVKKLRTHELEVLDKAKQEDFPFHNGTIRLYEWGDGDKTVLFIHGWEGQAGNFADLVEEFLKHDYKIFAFDGPSHGFSSSGHTSLFEFTELVGVLIEKYEVKHLVSHSFGGVATTYALYENQHLEIEKYCLLTTPDKFSERIQEVSDKAGITEKVKNLLIERLQNETGKNVFALNVSDFVKEINVKKALIIHDKNDRVIPISKSKNVRANWPQSSFEEVEGTGHFRILRDERVIKSVIGFLEK